VVEKQGSIQQDEVVVRHPLLLTMSRSLSQAVVEEVEAAILIMVTLSTGIFSVVAGVEITQVMEIMVEEVM
jgi:hypothetical protein